uniref:Methyltransferase domain-containing protein n=1 Tax=Mucochytrium quahogii TaxID=96639 RepID=A0A7S2RX09_9STRA
MICDTHKFGIPSNFSSNSCTQNFQALLQTPNVPMSTAAQEDSSPTGAYVKSLYKDHSQNYAGEKEKGWRVDMERYSTLKWAGDLTGKRVLDLGSGTGVYSRLMAQLGAREVIGVDVSEDMCALATAQSTATNSPVSFREGNCMSLESMKEVLPGEEGAFDVVLLSCLLCNCRCVEEVEGLAEVISYFLNKETGVFAGMDHHPEEEDYPEMMFVDPFGYSKTFTDRHVDGSELMVKLYGLGEDGSVVMPIKNYHYSQKCLEERFGKFGLSLSCPPLEVDPHADQKTYAVMVENPSFVILTGRHQRH